MQNPYSQSGASPPQVRGSLINRAAEYLGSTPWFVEVAIRSKQVLAHKLGRHYVLFKDDLDAYINRVRSGGGL
jgi:excisionase family DNA binding protein